MTDQQSASAATVPVVTTKDTVAAYKLADMCRVLQHIEADDLQALDKLMLSGRAPILSVYPSLNGISYCPVSGECSGTGEHQEAFVRSSSP